MSVENTQIVVELINLLNTMAESKPNEWIPLASALCGVVVGALASMINTYCSEKRREKKFSRSVLSSLVSEISALLKIVRHREYQESVRQVITYLQQQPEGYEYPYTVESSENYSRIYQENAKHIGCLADDVASDIVTFYQLIDSINQDVKAGWIVE